MAHVAVVAGKRFETDDELYIIVVTTDDINYFVLDPALDNYVGFLEPDLDLSLTAVAVLNPPQQLVSHLPLFGCRGGEKNGN